MADITASMVKELREMTGAGMMECKKALKETDGDMEAAVDYLRTRGLAALAKKAGRATNEGTIAAFVSDDAKLGVLVEVNCETDFVGRNEEFTSFVGNIAQIVADGAPADVEDLKTKQVAERGISVEQMLGEVVGKLGENMAIARFERDQIEGTGAVASYVHGGGTIGVLVDFAFGNEATASNAAFQQYSRDIAMQVAASQPMVATRNDVPADVIEHEMSIYKAQAAESGKPEQIQEKIAEGRLEKFYKEIVLVEQVFVKDPDVTVAQYTDSVSKEIGDTVSVVGFTRFVLGECATDNE